MRAAFRASRPPLWHNRRSLAGWPLAGPECSPCRTSSPCYRSLCPRSRVGWCAAQTWRKSWPRSPPSRLWFCPVYRPLKFKERLGFRFSWTDCGSMFVAAYACWMRSYTVRRHSPSDSGGPASRSWHHSIGRAWASGRLQSTRHTLRDLALGLRNETIY